ncbi:MAG: hypothetical protein Q9224_007218, partial [Gallowayella concinna]
EGVTKVIDLSADTLPLVIRMMKYFYVLDYEDFKIDEPSEDVTDYANPEANNDDNEEVTDEVKEQMDISVIKTESAQLDNYEANLRLHVQMHALGDKYRIDCLRDLATAKFGDACHELGACEARNKPSKFAVLLDLVPIVYEMTQAEAEHHQYYPLRFHLTKAIKDAIETNSLYWEHAHLKGICLQNAEFAYDVMRLAVENAFWRLHG